MTITFPTLNGVVLLTVTDKVVSEMVIGIVPLMALNGALPALFILLRRRMCAWPAIALCLLLWAAFAALLEWPPVWRRRAALAAIAVCLIGAGATWAFCKLRASLGAAAAPIAAPSWRNFIRDRAPRILWFFLSLAIVSWVAYAARDAHSLVGRLSALPLVPLFVLHWAVEARRADPAELRAAALIGPVAAGAFLVLFTMSLGLIRSDTGELHAGYWPIGLALLVAEWELTRRLILWLSRKTVRTAGS